MKWIEVNIGLHEDISFMNKVLPESVFPLVDKHKERVKSWHFLWEGKPWPEIEKKGTTLRLRFFGEDKYIERLRSLIDGELKSFEEKKPDKFFGHCFGRHGDCNIPYEGQEEDWGPKGWELIVKILQFGSETAMELIKNKDEIGKKDYKKDIFSYADRYTHLFLNPLTLSMPLPFNEISFYLIQAIQRIAKATKDRQFPPEKQNALVRLIGALIRYEAMTIL